MEHASPHTRTHTCTLPALLCRAAIGNDGPLYGTLNNPADQNDVIGVGGIDFGCAGRWWLGGGRGQATCGGGRMAGVVGVRACQPASHLSSPCFVCAGARLHPSAAAACQLGRSRWAMGVASRASAPSPPPAPSLPSLPCPFPRWKLLNPASMKQALVEGAVRLPGLNLYEQVGGGGGRARRGVAGRAWSCHDAIWCARAMHTRFPAVAPALAHASGDCTHTLPRAHAQTRARTLARRARASWTCCVPRM